MHIVPDKKAVVKSALECLVWTVILLVTTPFILMIQSSDKELMVMRIVFLAIEFGFLGIMWVMGFPLRILWLKRLSYNIEPSGISIHKGILTKTQQNIPYQKITDFKLVRSLFDRLLGIASIQIQTAGQAAVPHEGVLLGLIEWDGLIGDLRAKLETSGDAKAPDVQPQESSANKDVLQEILSEIKAIRTTLEKK